MRFTVKNQDIFPLPNNSHMLHLGTIGYGVREFIVMLCVSGAHSGKMYIEEAVLETVDFSKDVFGNLKFITDDHLFEDLFAFATDKMLTDVHRTLNVLGEKGKLSWLTGS